MVVYIVILYLELSEAGENSELHLLELEEWMAESFRCSESLPRGSHKELTDLWGPTQTTTFIGLAHVHTDNHTLVNTT